MLLIAGIILFTGFYAGQAAKKIQLPSIIGFMIIGLLLGPSGCNLLNENIQESFSFITEVALGFVAFSIGLELSLVSLKSQGWGIILIILAESFCAFIVVALGVYFLTGSAVLGLTFGALAPASAPAGTVAVIQEYRARGSLTKALYAVVGFDDGLAIIIFGFAAAMVRILLQKEMPGSGGIGFWTAMISPLREIGMSVVFGVVLALVLCLLLRKIRKGPDLLIMVAAVVFIINGLCFLFHLSLIMTNMLIGLVIVNTQRTELVEKIGEQLSNVMPLFFVLFFALAGANLHISELPKLGILGIVYIACRTTGLMGGAALGATIGRSEPKLRKYVGLGILSQAGVAIGLALIIKHDFHGIGKVISGAGAEEVTAGDELGAIVITTVTATCIFFEVIGPICTKYALSKAGEIQSSALDQ